MNLLESLAAVTLAIAAEGVAGNAKWQIAAISLDAPSTAVLFLNPFSLVRMDDKIRIWARIEVNPSLVSRGIPFRYSDNLIEYSCRKSQGRFIQQRFYMADGSVEEKSKTGDARIGYSRQMINQGMILACENKLSEDLVSDTNAAAAKIFARR